MTDANTASATTLASDAGMAGAANGGGQGSTSASADPLAGLQDAGIREWVGKSGFKDITPQSFEGLAKKARDAESLIGKSVQLPGDNATAEELAKFYNRLGRPEKADAYEFKLPDGLPANFNYDAEQAKAFKDWA